MLGAKVAFDEREINARPLDGDELASLIGKRDYISFLNTRNELYREREMKKQPPPREQALKLMAAHPNLMRRPILVVGSEVLLGFDEAAFRKALE